MHLHIFFIKIGMLDTRYLYLQNKTNKKLIVFDEKQSGIQMQNGVRYGMGQQANESWRQNLPSRTEQEQQQTTSS